MKSDKFITSPHKNENYNINWVLQMLNTVLLFAIIALFLAKLF